MQVAEAVDRLGGITSRKPLLRLVTRGELERAVAAADVVRVARGRYALPTDKRLAARLTPSPERRC